MSRTTVRLDDELLAKVKVFAALHNRSMNSVLEDALRQMLHRHETLDRPPVRLPTFGGDGLQPGVDASPAGIKQILEDEDIEQFVEVQCHDAHGR